MNERERMEREMTIQEYESTLKKARAHLLKKQKIGLSLWEMYPQYYRELCDILGFIMTEEEK